MSSLARAPGYKRQKTSNDTDRISNLPTSVIYHILSFLPTKDAVATSLLSTSWKFHWENINSLVFSDQRAIENKNVKFAHFVSRVLLLLNQQAIDTFSLALDENCQLYDVTTWITTAVARKLKRFVICFENVLPSNQSIQFPRCLFTCETLERLVLLGVGSLKFPSFACLPNLSGLHLRSCDSELFADSSSLHVCFPNLTILVLEEVTYKSDGCVCKLISGLPSLKTLFIERHVYDNVVNFTISSHTLKILTYLSYGAESPVTEELDYRLKINAPALQFLNMRPSLSRDLSVVNLCSLDEAKLLVHYVEAAEMDQCSKAAVELLKGVYNVKHLTLCNNILKALSHAREIPSLLKLTRLRVAPQCCSLDWLLKFVEQSRKLEFLEFNLEGMDWTSWSDPEKVPSYLSISLKTVVLLEFKGSPDQLAMVAYILRNAKFLTTMRIKAADTLDLTDKFQLLQKVSEFPRESKNCQVSFS